ncbi:MAG: NAD(P)-dependent glycerol-3-phosphate dehydrogenase [Chitinophagales bacterium]|nr:NAD(P)-dependent glycerol-3-phosphate dehydrogenase [Chitinophagales bacterium]MCO5281081.1 NAD(P)-dependent glycerol-3-phosphate dehydrogenase [Chitinophagales bacterium]OJV26217.1 MAG: glycerol 3-phosphate dehydrogenase [Bacteroidetes bacterium 37-13]HRP40371.1 NAD(P)H-dependent glycerol-3-phosphate dehydrogenase [Chitinophagales bacterium]
MKEKIAGVIGAGSFGSAIANLLAENMRVFLYERTPETAELIRTTRKSRGHTFNERVYIAESIEELAEHCYIIFPAVPSQHFKAMIQDCSPYLRPDHIVIHATKGLHTDFDLDTATADSISLKQIKTMSELIREETGVVRIGCLAGPNLAAELAEHQPAATVIASRFNEVIQEGRGCLRSERLQVFGNKDLLGIELAGVLKNYVALAAGALSGLGYGENARALLITRGMAEMIYIGKALGADKKAFLGMAGIGDLMATCSSPKSRNYTVGYRMAKGEKLETILTDLGEVAEGVRTLKIGKLIVDKVKQSAPILLALNKVFFGNWTMERAINSLMRYPVKDDAEYLNL